MARAHDAHRRGHAPNTGRCLRNVRRQRLTAGGRPPRHVHSLRTHFRCFGVAGSTAMAIAREMQNPRKGRVMLSFHRHGTGRRRQANTGSSNPDSSLGCTKVQQKGTKHGVAEKQSSRLRNALPRMCGPSTRSRAIAAPRASACVPRAGATAHVQRLSRRSQCSHTAIV